MRGFLSGVFWGGLVSMLGVAGASQLVPIPPEESLFGAPAAKPVAPAPAEAPEAVEPTMAAAPAPEDPAPAEAPASPAPETTVSVAPAAPAVTEEPAVAAASAAPEPTATAEPAAAQSAPVAAASEPTVSAAPAAPAVTEEPNVAAMAPAAPEASATAEPAAAASAPVAAASEPTVSAAPATPAVTEESEIAAAPAASEPTAATEPAAAASATAAPAPETVVSGPEAAPAETDEQVVIVDPAPAPAGELVVPAAAGGAADPAPAAIPATPPALPLTDLPAALTAPEPPAPVTAGAGQDPVRLAQAGTGQPPEPLADQNPAPVDLPPPPPLTPAEEALVDPGVAPDGGTGLPGTAPAPMVPASPATDDAAGSSSTLAPAPGLGNEVAGVRTNRLPRIGDAPAAEPDPAPEAAALPADAPPLLLHARAFENPAGKPLFAVVLFDTGAADLDRAALAALPFPVTFVVDPLAPGAAEAATAYRAGGQEVVMLASGVPAGATAADLEQTLQAHAAALPEAVAVIDAEAGGLQGNRPLATQIVPILKAQGRGLVTWDRGLNAADQVARRDGLPTASIFRRVDGEGEAAIRRNLDRAAFRAAQEGRVMVAGDTAPDTVAALLAWSLEGRAATVALAPVSAVLSAP